MFRCDVLIVGGGPAGSTCARELVRSGVDVAVFDRAVFPRDKVCAGWITPAVVEALALDLDDYGARHTLQPFTTFRTGTFEGRRHATDFGRIVSYGIRRCEFDGYLLERSGARVLSGDPVRSLERDATGWIVNGQVRTALLVGAGGHFCPVARWLNRHQPSAPREQAILAQEIEFRLDDSAAAGCLVRHDRPELFFWPDLLGYGWCVRKGPYLNVGVGRLTPDHFPASVRAFSAMVERRRLVPGGVPSPWKGHAYLVNRTSRRQIVDDRVLLVGDAAGLALAPSGEGILTAIESGLMAASCILDVAGDYSRASLARYDARIERRIGPRGHPGVFAHAPGWLTGLAGRAVFQSPWLTRRLLLEDGFLHLRRPPVERAPVAV